VNTNTCGAWMVSGHRGGLQSCWCGTAAAPPEALNFFAISSTKLLSYDAKIKRMLYRASVSAFSPLFAAHCALRPNPSIERTNYGLRPPFAAHVNR
jgi:hypothetical protein